MLYLGNTAITTADDISIIEEINGDMSLSFFLPWGDSFAAQISEGDEITERYYNDQKYIVEKIDKEKSDNAGYRISGRHVYFTAEKKFIAAFPHQNGESAANIFEDIWSGTGFEVLSAAEITALGMTPVTTLTDFEDKDKTDPISLTAALIKAVGQGEVYTDNKTVALVEKVGAQYNRLTVSLTENADSITVSTDISSVITRLYPYGKNDLNLTKLLGVPYIDSPNLDPNDIKEGYMDFSEISDNQMLLARGQWQFDNDNPNRIDVPYTTISCKFIDLSDVDPLKDAPQLGQDISAEGYTDKRIIKITRRPLEPENTDIVIGQIKKDLFYFFKRFNNTSIDFESGNINITQNPQTVTQIVEVTKQEVVAADVIEASAAFIDDLQIERLETNLKNFICPPNITIVNDVPQWSGNSRTWHAKTGYGSVNVRGYIKIYGMQQEFIEAQLVTPADSTHITAAELEAVQINGRQLYYTSIAGAQAFSYFTFTAPTAKYSTMSADIAAMYVVYKRKSSAEYIKAKNEFEWIAADNTYYVKTQYGVGDAQGRGVYYFIKDRDSGRFVYISRTTGKENGVVLKDDGIYDRYNDNDFYHNINVICASTQEAEALRSSMPAGKSFAIIAPGLNGGGS